MKDRAAALMVRAAASGAFNYANADPYNRQWRLKHLLILREVARADNEKLLLAAHAHWLSYVGHSNLDENSWKRAKEQAADALNNLQTTIFPWATAEENKDQTDTINNKYGDLIASYRQLIASKNPEPPKATE